MKDKIILIASLLALFVIALFSVYYFIIFLPTKERSKLDEKIKKAKLLVCIPSGDESSIQKVLKGKGAKAILCKNSVFYLNKPVTFTAPEQELYTEGLATDSSRALLKIKNKNISAAIIGYNTSGIKIKNIRVDGNRRELGRLTSHGLILIGGNAQNQEVDHIEAFDTRSWTTLHINFGDFYVDSSNNKQSRCKNAKVTNNTIGPSGWLEGGEWADGISLQCGESLVANNTITDVTDGGIVIFGAPGSYIINNTITAVNKALFIGIGLVDYAYDGNYIGTTITGNIINAQGAYVKVGIGMGPSVWWCLKPGENKINRGGIVTNNRIIGQYFGYGFLASGVKDWTVEGNISTARHTGITKNSCSIPNSAPAPFLIQQNNSQGNFQNEFRYGNLQAVIDISPLTKAWLLPYCSGSDFRGCTLMGEQRCSDWGNSNYLNWNYDLYQQCKDACNNKDQNNFCSQTNASNASNSASLK